MSFFSFLTDYQAFHMSYQIINLLFLQIYSRLKYFCKVKAFQMMRVLSSHFQASSFAMIVYAFILMISPFVFAQSHQDDQKRSAQLKEAIELYQRTQAHRLTLATDPNERYENSFGLNFFQQLIQNQQINPLFQLADEAFESEINADGGASLGPLAEPRPQAPIPIALPSPIHRGEYGGIDGNSCRSCHFSGGPDGAGNATQKAFLRGDGKRISTSTQRDAPHLLGLGYLSIAIQEIHEELLKLVDNARTTSIYGNQKTKAKLQSKGIDFGWIEFDEKGQLIQAELIGISKDLKPRIFGWKGRFFDLSLLVDEALQIHHGLQTTTRIDYYRYDSKLKEKYLGEGTQWDPDQDGMEQELGEGQALMLSAYLSLLPIPQIKVPKDLKLMSHWAEGRKHFEAIGCATCHIPKIYLKSLKAQLFYPRNHQLLDQPPIHAQTQLARHPIEQLLGHQIEPQWRYELDLEEHGNAPKPRRIDFGSNQYDVIEQGTPIFAFTDFKRHDLGEALSDKAEALTDIDEEIPAQLWVTRPLWGLADTAPYLHDGRAQSLAEAILWHGGEAQQAKELYLQLSPQNQAQLRAFLMSLSREGVLLVE
jgi:hypothetical protein